MVYILNSGICCNLISSFVLLDDVSLICHALWLFQSVNNGIWQTRQDFDIKKIAEIERLHKKGYYFAG